MKKSIFRVTLSLVLTILLLSAVSCDSSGKDSDKPSDEEAFVLAAVFSAIDDIVEGYLSEEEGLSIEPDLPIEEDWENYIAALEGNTYTVIANNYFYNYEDDDIAEINGTIILNMTDLNNYIMSVNATINNLVIVDDDGNRWVINSSGLTINIDTWEEEFVSGSGKVSINNNEYSVADVYDAIVELY